MLMCAQVSSAAPCGSAGSDTTHLQVLEALLLVPVEVLGSCSQLALEQLLCPRQLSRRQFSTSLPAQQLHRGSSSSTDNSSREIGAHVELKKEELRVPRMCGETVRNKSAP